MVFKFSAVNFIHYIVVHYKIPTMNSNFECTYDVPYIFTPVYHNAMRLCISEGEKKVGIKPLGLALFVSMLANKSWSVN